jgi:hypothetical protein
MSNRDKWRLCGGTFFILISDARKAMPSHDEMYMGKKSGITEPETLFALAKIVTPDLQEPLPSEEKSWRDGTFDLGAHGKSRAGSSPVWCTMESEAVSRSRKGCAETVFVSPPR